MALTRAYHSLYSSDVVKPGIFRILMRPPFVFVVWALSVIDHGAIKSTTGGDGIYSSLLMMSA